MAIDKITAEGIADNAIGTSKIGADVIVAEDIAANAITVSEIQDNAVTTAKILDANITTDKIADLGVTHAKLHSTMDLSSKTVTLPTLANLNTTGNVGIGTTSPSSPLHVSGSNGVIATLGATTELQIYVDNNEVSFRADADNDENSTIMSFDIDGTERMRLDGSGNLGIGITSPTVPVHVAPDGTYSKTTPFTLSGGKLYSNDIYTDYVYKWSGNATRTVDLLCNSYHMAEVTYTSHQTNGGSDIHRHIKGKWANNHTTHTWTPYTNTGDTWSIGLSISATDQSGSSSGSPNGRLRVRQTYGSGSYAYSTLTIRTYYDAFTGINISTS